MMRGIIVAVHEKSAVVLKQDGTFAEVRNKGYEPGQSVKLPEKTYRKYAALVAGLMLLFLGGISGYAAANTATSYVYVDINPSLRLDINVFDSVISVIPLNEDARQLLENAEVYNKDIRTCVENIIAASEMEEYLNETNKNVELSVMSSDEEVREVIVSLTEYSLETLKITATELTEEECKEALEAGVSAGWLEAVKAYTEYFGGTLDENMVLLEELSMRKIYSKITTAEREKQRAEREAARQAEAEQRKEEQKAEWEAEREAARQERAEQREKEQEERRAEREAERREREEQREKEK